MASSLFKWDTGQGVDKTAIHTDVNGEINGLTDKATPANSDVLAIEDSAASYAKKKLSWTNIKAALKSYFDTLYKPVDQGWIYANDPRWVGTFAVPLTSASWDGDAYSTTGNTLIDLSATFGVPAGAKAILARIVGRDSGSAAATELYIGIGPSNTVPLSSFVRVDGAANNSWRESTDIIPCNADGDVYYAIIASGAGTMDVIIRIWGYYL